MERIGNGIDYKEVYTHDNNDRKELVDIINLGDLNVEKKGSADKVVKHMEGFKQLLDHQLKDELISEKAYNSLKNDADTLIRQWE